ncbi:hypothetical protein EGT49_05800 [Companilactobacillus suantsaicola]|uniref:Uncharacterized protein n=1 Tax=Companilactobacillus suantsaicola TaxID=2487723 RepID=A0A4Z0JNU8_9LACO|nr:hypothetical protein EGT49_05800 [Companilactobacillus suantsaicola]
MKYAVLHSKADFGGNVLGTTLSFCKVRKISKLGLILSAKNNFTSEPNRLCYSGLNNGSMIYLLSVHLGILILFIYSV